MKPRIGVVSVPWTGVPPKNSLGSIGNIVHELTRPLVDRYSFVLVGGTSRSTHREVPGVDYAAIDDTLDNRLYDPAWRVAGRVRGHPQVDWQRPNFHHHYANAAADRLAAAGCDLVFVLEYPQWLPLLRQKLPRARLAYWGESGISVHAHGDDFARYTAVADGAIGCSRYVQTAIEERSPTLAGRVRVVHNGFDPERFAGVADGDVSRKITFVGRVTPDKGIHTLVDAFRMLAVDRPDLELVVAGPVWVSDPATLVGVAIGHEQEIEALARPNLPSLPARIERKLRRRPSGPSPYRVELERRAGPTLDRVRFTGAIVGDDLPKELAGSLAFVQPSLVEEGFPLTSLEAMACGLPLITTDRGGTREMVEEGGNGHVVPSGDPEAMAAALRPLVDDPSLQQRMSARALELAPRYTWAACAQDMAAAIDEILAR